VNRRDVPAVACLLVACTVIGAAIGLAPAHADPAGDRYAAANGPRICRTLTSFPNFAGIEGIADAIHFNDGFTYRDAGAIEATAVLVYCPQFVPLLEAFINTYSPPQVAAPVGGAIGGPYVA
jgi:hypothetical protein